MKYKIIHLLSYSTLIASVICVPFMALTDLNFLPCCIWVAALWMAWLGVIYTWDMDPENENAPDERQLSQGQTRKFYNIILTENEEKVNETL